jgi:hypothetical protein
MVRCSESTVYLFITRHTLASKESPGITLTSIIEAADTILTTILMLANLVLSVLFRAINSSGVGDLIRSREFPLVALASKESPFFTFAAVIKLTISDLSATSIPANIHGTPLLYTEF